MKHEDFESRTHSPKGEYAATDENYERLLSRLKTERPKRPTVTMQRSWMQKWSIAASVAIVCGLAWAAAWHSGWTFGFGNDAKPGTEEVSPLGVMSFTDTPLSSVLMVVAERYGMNYTTLDAETDMNITAEFAVDESLEEVLEALSMVSGLDIYVEGNTIIVR